MNEMMQFFKNKKKLWLFLQTIPKAAFKYNVSRRLFLEFLEQHPLPFYR